MSAYSDEERARILAEARALLEVTDGEHGGNDASRHVSDAEPRWPVRGPIVPTISSASMDRWREEALATERMLQEGRENLRREERRIIRERQAATFRTELDARTDAITEAVGGFVAESIDKVRDDLRAELQAAITGLRVELAARQDRSDKAVTIIDMPNPLRRRSSDAA